MRPARPGCSEFPNDNPALHDGAVWVCRAPCERPRAVVRPGATASASAPPQQQHGAAAAGAPDPSQQDAAPSDAFPLLVEALQRAALARGATRAAAVVSGLLFDARLDDAVDPAARAALLERGVAEAQGDRLSVAATFVETLRAWRNVLGGTSEDLSSCGARTLDEWAARVLGALLGAPEAHEKQLRRELRRQGVAAFGMLAQAA